MTKIAQSVREKQVSQLSTVLSEELEIEQIAYETKFYRRAPKKILATTLFTSFWQMQQHNQNSLSSWALQLGIQINDTVDGQSINERLNERSTKMAQEVLLNMLNHQWACFKTSASNKLPKSITSLFNRILIRDSTTQKVPNDLVDTFKGNYSRGTIKAVARIQALFDFTSMKWLSFEVGPYTDNDQKAAACITSDLVKDDLVLQDLGYFTLNWIEQLTKEHYLISKWHPNVNLYLENGQSLDIIQQMKQRKELDINVLVGQKKKVPMRLVARRLPKKKAVQRIKAAKKDRHSKTNHSKTYYELLKYEIYLTNIELGSLNGKQVAQIYGLRWYIEILFKSWKSCTSFKAIFSKEKMHLERVRFMIYAFLIQFVWLTNFVLYKIRQLPMAHNRRFSAIKFISVAQSQLSALINLKQWQHIEPIARQFVKHATYPKHSKRKNMLEKLLYVNELCINI